MHSLPHHPADYLAASVVALRSLQGLMTGNCFVAGSSCFRHSAAGRAEYHLAADAHRENLLEAGSCSSSSEDDHSAVAAVGDAGAAAVGDVVAAGYLPTCRIRFGLNCFARAYCRLQPSCCLARSYTGRAVAFAAAVPNSDARCH